MIEQGVLPQPFSRRMESWKCGSGTFRMNVALSELPGFTCLPGKTRAEHHTAGIIIAPSLAYMEDAWMDARRDGWSKLASLFCQHVAPTLPDGKSWDDHREEVADLMIATVDRFAPGFKKSVIARQINSPLDLERTFGLVGGDIFHGALGLDQLFSARPMLGYADYRTPVKGLYQCGSGTQDRKSVTGAPGHNAAREMLRDLR